MKPMSEDLARAIEGLVGPLVAQGMSVGIAEKVAKVRAWHDGTWEGEPCDQCGERLPLPFERGAFKLCYRCDGIRAVMEQREKTEERMRKVAGDA